MRELDVYRPPLGGDGGIDTCMAPLRRAVTAVTVGRVPVRSGFMGDVLRWSGEKSEYDSTEELRLPGGDGETDEVMYCACACAARMRSPCVPRGQM
jgi:hypothetical protein